MPMQVNCGHCGHQQLRSTKKNLSVSDIVDMVRRKHPKSDADIMRILTSLMILRDREAHRHGQRTAQYAVALGNAIGFTGSELIHLHFAAVLHDIGRLTLPAELLLKKGPLSLEEYRLVQCHPRSGAEILAALPFLQVPAVWIAHHHEHWDGSGYPYGLRGTFIPLGSRALAVADMFDAVISQNVSPSSKDYQFAMRQLRIVSGSQLDPEVVQTFLRIITCGVGFPVESAIVSAKS